MKRRRLPRYLDCPAHGRAEFFDSSSSSTNIHQDVANTGSVTGNSAPVNNLAQGNISVQSGASVTYNMTDAGAVSGGLDLGKQSVENSAAAAQAAQQNDAATLGVLGNLAAALKGKGAIAGASGATAGGGISPIMLGAVGLVAAVGIYYFVRHRKARK